MQINIDEIQVKIKFVEMDKFKAIVALDFGDFVIKGFRIRESNFSECENAERKSLWLTPPSYFGGNKWHPIFFVPDKESWQRLERKILDEYACQSKEHFKKRLGLDDSELL